MTRSSSHDSIMDALRGSPKSEDIYCVYIYFSSKFPAMTRSSSHDSIMDALSGSPKSEDSPEAKLEKEVSKMSLYLVKVYNLVILYPYDKVSENIKKVSQYFFLSHFLLEVQI